MNVTHIDNVESHANATPDVNWTSFDFDEMGELDLFGRLHVKVLFIIVYCAVFIVCFIGNLLVILVVLLHRNMRTITNFFLANLALADLCVGIFCILPHLSTYLSPYWKLGKVMCKLYYCVQAMAYAASIIILTVISIERYFAILHPFRSKRWTTMHLMRIVVIVIWAVAAFCGAPFLLFYNTLGIESGSGEIVYFCVNTYRSSYNPEAYVIINFMLWYLIPLVCITIMYCKICVVLWKTSQGLQVKSVKRSETEETQFTPINGRSQEFQTRTNNESTYEPTNGDSMDTQRYTLKENPPQHQVHVKDMNNKKTEAGANSLQQRRRVIKLLLAVIGTFAVCVLPNHVQMLWQTFHQSHTISYHMLVLRPVTYVLLYLNSAINPILYAFFSQNFRVSLHDLLRGRRRKCVSATGASKTFNTQA